MPRSALCTQEVFHLLETSSPQGFSVTDLRAALNTISKPPVPLSLGRLGTAGDIEVLALQALGIRCLLDAYYLVSKALTRITLVQN